MNLPHQNKKGGFQNIYVYIYSLFFFVLFIIICPKGYESDMESEKYLDLLNIFCVLSTVLGI